MNSPSAINSTSVHATPGSGAPRVMAAGLGHSYIRHRGRRKRTTQRTALAGLDLDIPAGQFLALIGPSGCGKSTLLRLLGGLETPTTGTVEVAGHDPRQVRGEGLVGFVPQSPALLPWRTVSQNLALLDELGGWPHRGLDAATIDHWLHRVELAEDRLLLPHQLSGGMQQRVALARAFAIEPRLLLLDEPFSALDELTRAHMQDLLVELWSEQGQTVIFVTHSIDEAVRLADRVIVMGGSPGRIVGDQTIDLERPRRVGIEDSPEFRRHAAAVRRILLESDQ